MPDGGEVHTDMIDTRESYCLLFLALVALAEGCPDLCRVALSLPLHDHAARLASLVVPHQR